MKEHTNSLTPPVNIGGSRKYIKTPAESLFPPATPEELRRRGWDRPDIILISGDGYIDSPLTGTAVIARHLEDLGYRVAVIPQPDINSSGDITRLGEPRLFWGITSGCVDSMVANYTALKKKRNHDDFTPGGINDHRPDRALVVYTNLIRRFFKGTVPIVLGGIEASTRRIAHYDFWSDSIRRSILFDAKADILIYGMGEWAAGEVARRLDEGRSPESIPGTCGISKTPPAGYLELPPFDEVRSDKNAFTRMFETFSRHSGPGSSDRGMFQAHGDRFLVHHPPPPVMSGGDLDRIHTLPFTMDAHPVHDRDGSIRALDTIRFSLASHRGCYGGCSFCSIAVHQGRTIVSRSEESIIREAEGFSSHPAFRGIISDVGGPSANMYGTGCKQGNGTGCGRLCLFPGICPNLHIDHLRQVRLLEKLRSLPGIRKVFIASGIRYDLLLADPDYEAYLKALTGHHVSGQLKIAPEHVQNKILNLMKKPGPEPLLRFKTLFDDMSRKAGKKQYLTYYFIAAHPGCTAADMEELRRFIRQNLRLTPEQVQIFTPLPSTRSALIYHTGIDPDTGKEVFVERDPNRRRKQKDILQR